MKKLLLHLLLLLALVVWIVGLVLRDELDGAVGESSANEGVKTAVPAAGRADEAGAGAAGVAERATEVADARRATTGSLRVRATAAAKDGTSSPLVDVLVHGFAGDGIYEPGDGLVQRLRTDERGEAVFASLAPGTFAVRAPTVKVATQHAVVTAAGETLVALRAEGADVVRGVVVDGSGARVAGADLWLVRDVRTDENGVLEPTECIARRAGRSAADGTFALVASDWSERRIAASHELHGESMARFVQAGRYELRLVLQPATAALQGTVRDADGKPVTEAAVLVEVGSQNQRRTRDGNLVAGQRPFVAVADVQGRFALTRLPQGGALVSTRVPPHRNANATVELVADRTATVELVLAEGLVVHGFVRGTKNVLQRARVQLFQDPEARRSLGSIAVRADGSYVLRIDSHEARRAGDERSAVPPKRPCVAVTVDGGPVAIEEIDARAQRSVRCDFVLDESLVTSGTLRNAGGELLKDWRIRLEQADAPWAVTRTDAKGTFVLGAAIPTTARLLALAPGSDRSILLHDGVRRGDRLELVVPDAAMPRGRVSGRLALASLPDFPFELEVHHGQPPVEHECRPEADGSFAFDGLVEGTWVLYFVHHGTQSELGPAIELAVAEQRDLGTIELPSAGRLSVDVVDENGRPWAGSTVGFRLLDANGKPVPASHETLDGKLGLVAAPGEYRLGALATDLYCELVPVTIRARSATQARLQVRVARSIGLRFHAPSLASGDAARALHVTVVDAHAATVLRTTLDKPTMRSNGQTTWTMREAVPFGPHRIEAATDDGLRFATDLDVTDSFDGDLVVDVPVVR